MIARFSRLKQHPAIFRALTSLQLVEFETLVLDLLPSHQQAREDRLYREERQRAFGGGRSGDLCVTDQILLTIIWLRLYPAYAVLGYLFGVSESTALRMVDYVLPLLEAAGRDAMRRPQPTHKSEGKSEEGGRSRGRSLEEILREVPELAVIVDSFEQRVQRPKTRKTTDKTRKTTDTYYSGKKKQHTLKSQVAINRRDGTFVDVSQSVPGPTADMELLRQSGLIDELAQEVWLLGDLAYLGVDKLHPHGLGATPRRKPRGRPRPSEDVVYNREFARERVKVEHSIGRLRHYQALSAMDRHHRRAHTSRVVAVAGLVNRQIRYRLPCAK